MGAACDLAPVLIRQFLHSYWSRTTAEQCATSRDTRDAHSIIMSCLPEGGGGLNHFIAGVEGCCVERNHLTIIIFAFILLFYQKVMMFVTEKVFMNGNQSVLNRFSTSGLNPPGPGS